MLLGHFDDGRKKRGECELYEVGVVAGRDSFYEF